MKEQTKFKETKEKDFKIIKLPICQYFAISLFL